MNLTLTNSQNEKVFQVTQVLDQMSQDFLKLLTENSRKSIWNVLKNLNQLIS